MKSTIPTDAIEAAVAARHAEGEAAGLGPLLVGSISDRLHAAGDPRPLAHSIGLLALAGCVSAVLFLRARVAALRNPGGFGETRSRP